MGMRINTNVQSLSAQRHLGNNRLAQEKSLEKLSSGSRINRSGDDAAGLAISESLKGTIRSNKQAVKNAQDGISLVQVAEGGMTEVSNILNRIRELSIQSASDTIGDAERKFVDKEVQALKSEINRIAGTIEFNGHKLLDGSTDKMEIQVGVKNDPLVDRFIFDAQKITTSTDMLGIAEVNNLSKESSQANLDVLDAAITRINENRSELGALQNRLQITVNSLGVSNEGLTAANSRIRDTDVAEESSELTRNNILSQSTLAVLAQANNNNQLALKLLG
jgi:flagellin